jgi:hypothetical protein
VRRAEEISRFVNDTWADDHAYSLVGLILAAAWNMKRHGMSKDDFLHLASTQWDVLLVSPAQVDLGSLPVSDSKH